MPTQNTGTAMPSWETPLRISPYQVFARWAARKPTGSAMRSARANARSVSGPVTSIRVAISGPTGRVLTKELPRSKVARLCSQVTNCSGSGRSDPISCRAAASCSGLAPTDASALAGSPGSSRSSRNSTTLASRREAARKASRLSMYTVMGAWFLSAPVSSS